jgi:hypothetical protein
MKVLHLIAPVILLLAAACSKSSSAPAPQIVIGAPELAAMLASISTSSFGGDYLSMEPYLDDSGPLSASDLIEDADNPDDEREDLTNFGFVRGHGVYFFRSDALADLQGPFVAGANVLLFETEDGASGYLEDDLSDGRRDLSGTTEVGSLQGFDTFNTDIGEESWGAFVRILGDAEFYNTSTDFETSLSIVSFRHGRIVGSAFVLRADGTGNADIIAAVARELDARVAAVLNGEKLGAEETGVEETNAKEVGTPEEDPAETSSEAEELLLQSRDRMEDLNSYRIVQEQYTTTSDGTFRVVRTWST